MPCLMRIPPLSYCQKERSQPFALLIITIQIENDTYEVNVRQFLSIYSFPNLQIVDSDIDRLILKESMAGIERAELCQRNKYCRYKFLLPITAGHFTAQIGICIITNDKA